MGIVSYFNLNKLRLKKLNRILQQVNSYKETMAHLTDDELKNMTLVFRERLASGESLDDILPEAFAVVREANKRVLGMYPYDVQVLGAIVLHQGNIAEMKTGEGKTLTATMPVYLNALTGQGVMVITANGYLARRDGEEMGEVYKWLGLTVAVREKEEGTEDDETFDELKFKQDVYRSDIIYVTNSTLGFDYLFDNLGDSEEDKFMREFNYAVIDEIDAVLLDSAQTPLIISGAPRVQSNLYNITANFINMLEEDVDYMVDEEKENVWLTRKGITACESFFSINNIYSGDFHQLIRHINLALKAKVIFEKDKKYVVKDKKVFLLDLKTGRLLDGTKLQSGQHQALEAKENVKITDDSRAVASITYQNLFRMFKKLSGMTGTGKVVEEEFIETYNMAVVVIPTNKPVIRIDYPDKIYGTLAEKLYASMSLLKELHAKGQPILLAVGSVHVSQVYSEMLLKEGIAHNVLNAYNAAKEAEIIKEAGQFGAVTVATSMAGRGTDIKLGKGVKELGGLAVIGTERMDCKRIDLQFKGRAGRQGDPGMSQFFISLEDELLIKDLPKWAKSMYKKHVETLDLSKIKELTSPKYSKLVNKAQASSEDRGKSSRKSSLEFDDSLRIQRNIIYNKRKELIERGDISLQAILNIVDASIENFINTTELNEDNVLRYILDNYSYQFKGFDSNFKVQDKKEVARLIKSIFVEDFNKKESQFHTKETFAKFKRMCVLKSIDYNWIEQVDNLQQLRMLVSNQKNPLFDYNKEALKLYDNMKMRIKDNIVKNLSLSQVERDNKDKVIIYFP